MGEEDIEFNYQLFMWVRRVELIFSSLCLAAMVIDILRRHTYIYNSVRLFMFVSLFYFIGMIAVLPYGDYIGHRQVYCDDMVLNGGEKTLCGASAFINLFSYNIAYFFAVMITAHLYQILNDNYRGFMKSVLTNKKIILGLLIMLLMYLLPWILIYDQQLLYYYPTGFTYEGQLYLFLCGINPKQDKQWLLVVFVYLPSFVLFLIHLVLLYIVSKKRQQFEDLERLNPKQKFIVRSNKLSLIVFLFQFVNLIKSVFVTEAWGEWLVIVLYYLFDLYPLLLLIFYCRDVGSRQQSMIKHASLLSSQRLKS